MTSSLKQIAEKIVLLLKKSTPNKKVLQAQFKVFIN